MSESGAALAATADAAHGSLLDRLGLSAWDGFALSLMVGLLLAYFPPFTFDGWTLRMAVLVGVLPLGAVLLVQRCRMGDRASWLIVAALGWGLLSALAGHDPRSSAIGFAGRELSLLSAAGSVACWSVGRLMSDRGRSFAPHVVSCAVGIGSLVGVAQVVFDVSSGELALQSGRPTGLVGNPVYFGALSAVGAVTSVAILSGRSWRWAGPSLVVSGMAVALSGSRVALLAAVGVCLCIAAVDRSKRYIASASLLAASLISGVLLDRSLGAGRNAADRITAETGSSGRLEAWGYGLEALIDRPLVGYGFGHFRPAVQNRFSADFVRTSASDDLVQAWFDPHNVGVNLLVSVGVVGTILFAVWAVFWARRIRGPLVWALLAIVVHWLLQPLSLSTLPLAMVLFAAAGPVREEDHVPVARGVAVGTAVVGGLLAVGLIVADLNLSRAIDTVDPVRAGRSSSWLLDDPVVADVVAGLYAEQQDSSAAPEVLEWRRRAAAFQPDRPLWWSKLAEAELLAGNEHRANRALDEALELQPYNARSQRVELLLAVRSRDVARLDDALELACELGVTDCSLVATDLLAPADGS